MGKRAIHLILVAVVLGMCSASWGQKATAPNPADGATDVMMMLLRWTPGPTAIFHDVYLGTTPDLGPEHLVSPNNGTGVYYSAMGVVAGTTYYWRVDAIDKIDGTIYTGDVWSFLAQPLTAFDPHPADGFNEVSPTPTLTWQKGMAATKHQVYLSDSFADVNDRAAAADKGVVTDTEFVPEALEELTTYYWCVDELGAATQAGEVWSFTTYGVVDDFESYTDDVEAATTIFDTWIDGLTNNTGSTVGYWEAPFCEQTIVHGGLQSMPFEYNNADLPYYSEGELDFGASQDWEADGVDTLTLYVQGKGRDFVIPSVSTPPVIDGEVDEIWSQASVQPINRNIQGAELTGPGDASGEFRVLYDIDYLYVVVDINDSELINDTANSWQDDSVEVYFDGGNTKAAPPLSGNNRQYTFGWTTDDIQGTNTNITDVEHAQVDTETGWRIEIRFPWQSLMGSSAPVGELIGIDCFYNDDDDGTDTRETQIAWHSTAGGDWETAASWGTALVAEPDAPDRADFLYVGLGDSSNRVGVVSHPDPEIIQASQWTAWKIPLSAFTDADVNLGAVRKLFVGVGDPNDPKPGGAGIFFVDDIYVTKPAAAEE